jgi:hydrogenase maturation factor HypE
MQWTDIGCMEKIGNGGIRNDISDTLRINILRLILHKSFELFAYIIKRVICYVYSYAYKRIWTV